MKRRDKGDVLVFHGLPQEPFEKSVKQNVLLSSGRLSEAALHAASREEEYRKFRYPKVVLALHRIS